MNRTAVMYVAMVVALVAGLWAILRVGSRLQAPHDLSGSWAARPLDASPDADPLRMEIYQSGWFLTLTLPDQPPIKVRLRKEEHDPSGQVVQYWEGDRARLVVRLPTPPKSPEEKARYWFELEEPTRITLRARRVADEGELSVASTAAEKH